MATFSQCGKYRFRLERESTNINSLSILFIMLNPSTASKNNDDKTTKIICEIANK